MPLPILSCIEIVIIMYIFLKKSTLKERFTKLIILLLIFEIIYPTGAFFQIGSVGVLSVYTVPQYVIGVYCVIEFVVGNIKIQNRLFAGLCVFFNVILFLLIMDYIYPYHGLVPYAAGRSPWDDFVTGKSGLEVYTADFTVFLISFLKLINCAIVITVAKSILDKNDLYLILTRVVFWGRYYCWIGAFDFFMQNILDSSVLFYDMRDLICGVNSNPDFNHGIKKGNFYAIVGFAFENSNFVMSMFYLIISMMIKVKTDTQMGIKEQYKCRLYILLSLALMALSGGFSAVWYMGMVVVCGMLLKADIVNYPLKEKLKIYTKFVMGLVLLLVMVYLVYVVSDFENSYYGRRLISVFIILDYFTSGNFNMSVTQDGVGESELARLTSLLYGGLIISERPLVGIGLGAMKIHDVTLCFIMSMGIIGVLAWVMFVTLKKEKNIHFDFLFWATFYFLGGLPVGTFERSITSFYFIFILLCTSLYCTKESHTM